MKAVASLKVAVVMCGALLVRVAPAQAEERISGVIARTHMLVEDTRLVGDVTCTVVGAPCVAFGAPGIVFMLDGFTVTGRADATSGCGGVSTDAEEGISTNGQRGVAIRGPGIVQRFRNNGIVVSATTGATVEGVTMSTNCRLGILVNATSFGTLVQDNIAVRNGSTRPGLRGGGIGVGGSNNRIYRNETSGNGYADPDDDFGIGIIGGSDNVVDENTVIGNSNGIVLLQLSRNNVVRSNTVVGNPPIQVSVSLPATAGVDVLDLAPAGQSTFERNFCVTSNGRLCPNASALAGRKRPEP